MSPLCSTSGGSETLLRIRSLAGSIIDTLESSLRPLEPRNLALVADLELEGAWRVEYFDSDGAAYITIFAGQAEARARDYYDAIERGALDTRIADAQVVTAKRVRLFPTETTAASALRRYCLP
jgi:hypothetical protein